jgi:uncharacterized LabA/DUF88 family protein
MRQVEANYAFIDGQNFYKSIQALENELEALEVELDFREFRVYLAEKHGVKVAYYFIGYLPQYKSLYDQLGRHGYKLIFKEVATHEDEIKGNVDVNLTLQSMVDYSNYAKAVIVTSDGDYACLVEYLHDNRKLECLIACSRDGCSYLLRKLHHKIRIYYLDDIIRDLYKRKETSQGRDPTSPLFIVMTTQIVSTT